MDSPGVCCPNLACPARGQRDQGNIRVHSQMPRRYRCTVCRQTFTASKGTALYRLHRPASLFVQVVTLLAYGCPPEAIVAAFGLDERTASACSRGWSSSPTPSRACKLTSCGSRSRAAWSGSRWPWRWVVP
jgi:transposase-like protein